MTTFTQHDDQRETLHAINPQHPARHSIPRMKSKDLMQNLRELEIDHEGRIYRLRITQLNKLILTA